MSDPAPSEPASSDPGHDSAPAPAPSGWYPQPGGAERFWDGAAWTEDRRPAPLPTYADPQRVKPKNPTLMLLVSFFVPGLGTVLNGETGKGLGILSGYVLGLLFTFVLFGLPFAVGFWLWGMIDAHVGAVKWNVRHGVVDP